MGIGGNMANAKKILVIVESPSKAKTIGKYLGSNYKVIASVGHVRDLPKSKLGIDIENNFEPQYISIRGKGDLIKILKKEAKQASKVYLATDPDREGEAISWHLAHLLAIDEKSPCRIVFNEITKGTIKEAIKNPRQIDLKLVDAQQARRVLDRLVGYQISPLLWRKIRRGLSAGRVQSAALKVICDRENLINGFIPKEYWNIAAAFDKGKGFLAKLAEYNGKKITVEDKFNADRILSELKEHNFIVNSLTEKERIRKPFAPFTTSGLQQEASTKLGFFTKRTMLIAQQLYEGVEIKGHGSVGLVTYIRTDSVRISDEAKAAAAVYITEKFGKEYLGNNVFSNKKKDIQDAHEAIRPSVIELEPSKIKESLSKDQYNLYTIIWNRFMASQMVPAKFSNLQAEIVNGDYTFKATGSKLLFDGYQKVYNSNFDDDKDKILPDIKEKEELVLKEITSEQNFTQPPARYTEASLVKELEENEIGRPSTYAPIIGTLIERKYVSREKKSLIPTDLGFTVTKLMENYFKEIVDTGFTAGMENQLDDVEAKDLDWKKVVSDFYATLKIELEIADEAIEKVVIEDVPSGNICEKCGKPMIIKIGRFGEFEACSGYPDCKNTKPIIKKTDVKCPICGKDIILRKSKKGKVFYGCSGYPECTQSYWYKPIDRKCPECGSILLEKKTKTSSIACSNAECGYKE